MNQPPDLSRATGRMRRVVTRLLGHEAGGDAASSRDLAAASGRLFDRLSERLAQVVGRGGVNALMFRAVHLCQREFPFLDERIVPMEHGAAAADRIRACLQEREPEVIRRASVTLLATFAGLLATVIGERLAWNLLRDVWPETLRAETEFEEIEE